MHPSDISDPEDARTYRAELVRELSREIRDARVLETIGRIPRHVFVPGAPLRRAYEDHPEPIGFEQTISQPTVVAMMTEALALTGVERVLEIGTGSGYQAAILASLAADVYTIELVVPLADDVRERLAALGYTNVHVRTGDGYEGWPEEAPFDRIVATAAPDAIPRALFEQLVDGGILVVPVGPSSATQRLLKYRRTGATFEETDLGSVRFVPMVPRA